MASADFVLGAPSPAGGAGSNHITALNPIPVDAAALDVPSDGFAITPNNTTDLPQVVRGIYVGVSGDITVDFSGGHSNVQFKAVPQGSRLEGKFSRVYVTGTSATNLVWLV